MISNAEAIAYIRWKKGDELSSKFVSPKMRVLARIMHFLIPRRFERIARRRMLLSKAIATELKRHTADTVLDLGAGYNTLGHHWIEKNPTKRFVEVDVASQIERKAAILPTKKGLQLVAGEVTSAATYDLLRQEIKGSNIVVLLEGVLSYLTTAEIEACFSGVESLLRGRNGTLITHQAPSSLEGQAIRSLLWGKRNDINVASLLSRRGWNVIMKESDGWTLIIAKPPHSTKKSRSRKRRE